MASTVSVTQLPTCVLTRIFQAVDSCPALLKNCALACRSWNAVLKDKAFWFAYCATKLQRLPLKAKESLSVLELSKIAHYRPLNRNLIKNPSGEEQYKHWDIESGEPHGTSGFQVERPAHDIVKASESEAIPTPVCFATSYDHCVKTQKIVLDRVGLSPFLMSFHPTIVSSEWHEARNDCGSVYKLEVALQDKHCDQQRNCKPCNPFDPEPTDRSILTSKMSTTTVKQWKGGIWLFTRLVFTGVPKKTGVVQFCHSGQDTQYWAGHYGPKMAHASVIVTFDFSGEFGKIPPIDIHGYPKTLLIDPASPLKCVVNKEADTDDAIRSRTQTTQSQCVCPVVSTTSKTDEKGKVHSELDDSNYLTIGRVPKDLFNRKKGKGKRGNMESESERKEPEPRQGLRQKVRQLFGREKGRSNKRKRNE